MFLHKKKKLKKYSVYTDIKYSEILETQRYKNLFEQEKENFYKPIRVDNFWSNIDIRYESNGDRNKTLSVEEHPSKIQPYLKKK